MDICEIRSGAVYETVHQQLRRVLRLSSTSVYYETIGDERPFYTSSVRKQRFAADAVREHRIAPAVASRRREGQPAQLDSSIEVGDGNSTEQGEIGQ